MKWLVTGKERTRFLDDVEPRITTEDPLAILEDGGLRYGQIYSVNR